MKLENIISEWEKDSKIDPFNLGNESIAIPLLHHKYYQIYLAEKAQYFAYESQYRKLKLLKYEFYTQGPTKPEHDGWQLPAIGKILRNDVQMYIDSDSDIIDIEMRVKYQKEKLDFVESIIKSLTNRGYQIKSAIDYEKFRSGI